jgi:hypothetical protein
MESMSDLEHCAIKRLKYIARQSNPEDGYSVISTEDLENLLAAVEALDQLLDSPSPSAAQERAREILLALGVADETKERYGPIE